MNKEAKKKEDQETIAYFTSRIREYRCGHTEEETMDYCSSIVARMIHDRHNLSESGKKYQDMYETYEQCEKNIQTCMFQSIVASIAVFATTNVGFFVLSTLGLADYSVPTMMAVTGAIVTSIEVGSYIRDTKQDRRSKHSIDLVKLSESAIACGVEQQDVIHLQDLFEQSKKSVLSTSGDQLTGPQLQMHK